MKLKSSWYLCISMPLLAGVLAIWVPFNPKFLGCAAIVGVLCSGVKWIGWLRETSALNQLAMMINIFGFLLSKDFWLPKNLSHPDYFIALAQYLVVWLFTFAVANLAGGIVFKNVLNEVPATSSSSQSE